MTTLAASAASGSSALVSVAVALIALVGAVTVACVPFLFARLRVIHTLVNSQMTAKMQSELEAKSDALVLLKEVTMLHASFGTQPTPETLALIVEREMEIRTLTADLQDRVLPGLRVGAPDELVAALHPHDPALDPIVATDPNPPPIK